MKANRPPLSLRSGLAAVLAVTVASCAAPPPPPPAPRPVAPPIYRPPPPPVSVAPDWRDRPLTPGTWRWGLVGGSSSARFAETANGALLEFRCDRPSGTVLMIRQGAGADGAVTTVTTTTAAKPLTARPLPGPNPRMAVTILARDPVLDAIAFSRGRFAVDTQGLGTLYVPNWPEVARVVEDCR